MKSQIGQNNYNRKGRQSYDICFSGETKKDYEILGVVVDIFQRIQQELKRCGHDGPFEVHMSEHKNFELCETGESDCINTPRAELVRFGVYVEPGIPDNWPPRYEH